MIDTPARGDLRGVRSVARHHPLATYVVLAYLLSWACWAPLVVHGSMARQGVGWPTDLPGLAGPAVAAALTAWLVGGRSALLAWSRRLVRWRAPGWCYGFVLLTAVLGLASAAVAGGDFWSGLAAYTGTPDLGLAITFLLVLVVNGIGEESGWRGYLADGLLREHDLLTVSAWVALAWAGWHAPLFLVVPSFRDLGFAAIGWLCGIFAGSVVLTWLYVSSGRSVLVVALWHTVFNFASGTRAMSGLPAAVTSTAVIVLAIVLIVRRRKEHSHEQSDSDLPWRRRHRDGQPVPRGRT